MNSHAMKTCASLALVFVASASAAVAAEPITNTPPALHNVFRLTPRVLSGSQPEGDAALAWLAAQGVKTIVSVDGARPDVEAARQHGLRYVHLPVGYDGVPTNRVAELAKLAATMPGPFYVHCHHGKHRGPAAAAVLCEASAHWSAAEAEAFLQQAGTARDYPGLYRSVREFRPPAAWELAALTNAPPEVAATPGLVQAMVALDGCMERLRACQQAGWRAPAIHPDLSPASESLQLWEQLRELGRSETPRTKPPAFRQLLETSERSADELRRALQETQPGSASASTLDARLRTVTESCSTCHVRYRN